MQNWAGHKCNAICYHKEELTLKTKLSKWYYIGIESKIPVLSTCGIFFFKSCIIVIVQRLKHLVELFYPSTQASLLLLLTVGKGEWTKVIREHNLKKKLSLPT